MQYWKRPKIKINLTHHFMETNNEIVIIEKKAYITAQLNKFHGQLVDNMLDYQRHLQIKKNDPKFTKATQQGEVLTVDQLLEIYRKNINNANAYIALCEQLLKVEEGGTWANAIEEANMVPSPLQEEGAK